jgi:hypothetical protein
MAYKTMMTSDYTIDISKVIVLSTIRVSTTSDYPIGICKVIVSYKTMTLQIPMG